MECHCLIVGGHREHVHMLYRRPPTLLTIDLLKELKRQSSLWEKEYRHLLKEHGIDYDERFFLD